MDNIKSFTRGPELDISRFYMGNVMSFLANGSDTGGRIAMIEGAGKLGNEPPPHVHLWEHEMYYVLEGEAEYFVEGEDKSLRMRPGQLAFLPQGKAHAIYFRSPLLRTLLMVVATTEHPVGLDEYFRQMSEQATDMELPNNAETYTMADPEHAGKVAATNGMVFLTPQQVKERLPHFPGFGANLPGGVAYVG